ncbi:MAG: SCP2 sterol-binding domain-containing protein [Saprospiraceae bacterium]|jgi:putative sterol carrier protein|nr:SCP2 sterol-binding domain-containing protein [Saprospiraceae bacterium]MDP4821930.1 SCP2 sterol-binding domain-containing protein [Saprospiraceae bacterium]MDP4997981.1 SCP2 sterol-binding domain-containing protein [Saprospiraceae bacterium]
MNFDQLYDVFQAQGHKIPVIGKTLKLVLEEGPIYIDMSGEATAISKEDKEADCTVTTTTATLQGLKDGSVNAMMAVMSGKIKVKGDMSIAMKLQALLS